MATSLLDTGEAFLSANEKRYARLGAPAPTIQREAADDVSPAVTIAVLILAIAIIAVVALIG